MRKRKRTLKIVLLFLLIFILIIITRENKNNLFLLTYKTLYIFNFYGKYYPEKSTVENEVYAYTKNISNISAESLRRFGLVFPRLNDRNFRIMEQLKFSVLLADISNRITNLNLHQASNRIITQIPRRIQSQKSNRISNRTSKRKQILRVGVFNFDFLNWRDGTVCFQGCAVDNCELTSDFGKRSEVDVLLISQLNEQKLEQLLPKPAKQLWIAQHLEPPTQGKIETKILSGLINWTASYRSDSTLSIPYIYYFPQNSKYLILTTPYPRTSFENDFSSRENIDPRNSSYNDYHSRLKQESIKTPSRVKSLFHASVQTRINPPNTANKNKPLNTQSTPSSSGEAQNFARGKRKKVAWVVSNCRAHNDRWGYAAALGRHIQVDIYGRCGDLGCEEKSCFGRLGREYKFYLAFENSNCADYITEKLLYNAFYFNMVPIVMGARRAEYEALLPDPSSFIHVDDFQSPLHLALHLKNLDANDSLYNRHFEWMAAYEVVYLSQTRYFCRLCLMLHLAEEVGYVRWIKDYSRWWDVCRD